MPKVLIICVNYHNEAQTASFVQQILQLQHSGERHIVVVNNNEDASVRNLSELFADTPPVTVMELGLNCGYYGAAALALTQYLRTNVMPDWVVVSNTDLLFPDNSFMNHFEKYSGVDDVGAIAPAVISTITGLDQNPFMDSRPSMFQMHLTKFMLSSTLTRKLWLGASLVKQRLIHSWVTRQPSSSISQSHRIYAPHGSFIAFSRGYFDRGGDLTQMPFLFGEEIVVAETARRLQLSVVYDPAFRLCHCEHSTTSKSPIVQHHQAMAAKHCADRYFPLMFRTQ